MIVGLMQNKSAIKKLAQKWEILPFDKVLKDRSGGNIKIKSKETLEDGLLPVIDQGKDFIAGYTDNEKAKANVSLPLVIFGDHTRILKYIDFDFAMGADGTKVLEVINNKAYPKFIYYYLRSLNIIDTGYNRHFKYVKDLVFPLPPLETQKRIAAILDDAAALRDKTQQLLTEYDQLAQSIFLEMFGDPATNQKKWQIKSINNLSEKIQIGPFGSQLHQSDYQNSGLSLVNPTDICDGKIDLINCKKISEDKFYSLPNYHLQIGDVIMARRGDLSKIAVVNDKDLFCGTGSLYVRLKKDINPVFFFHFLINDSTIYKLYEKARGITMANLNKTIIKEFEVQVPPRDLQNQFSDKITLIKQQKELAKQELQECEILFNCLLQKAFKGELV